MQVDVEAMMQDRSWWGRSERANGGRSDRHVLTHLHGGGFVLRPLSLLPTIYL